MKQAYKHPARVLHSLNFGCQEKLYKNCKGSCLVPKRELNQKGKYILLF